MMSDQPGKPEYLGGGFDPLRLLLAVFILYVHAGGIFGPISGSAPSNIATGLNLPTSGPAPSDGIFKLLGISEYASDLTHMLTRMAVPMFFALSGYLVAGSAQRTKDTFVFLAYRILRILPALTVEVSLSALVLGPIFTALPLPAYFSDGQFYRYFLNILGYVTYSLPGVFIGHPHSGIVNWNLWTLPGEFYCYLFLSVCMISGFVYDRTRFLIVVVGYGVVIAVMHLFFDMQIKDGFNYRPFFLVLYFGLGAALYSFRDRVPFNGALALGAFIASYVLLKVGSAEFIVPVFLVYLTVAVGRLPIPFPMFLRKNDISYGIYLYGFPISQALLASTAGTITGRRTFIALSIGVTALLATASWIMFERPALRLKSRVPRWRRLSVAGPSLS